MKFVDSLIMDQVSNPAGYAILLSFLNSFIENINLKLPPWGFVPYLDQLSAE
jgi:hypothetical protein